MNDMTWIGLFILVLAVAFAIYAYNEELKAKK
jgi:hypothetical protein